MSLPYIQARITNGLIGMNWSLGEYSIRSRSAELATRTTPTRINATMSPVRMDIELSKTHKALTGGNPLQLFRDLQGRMAGHAQQTIGRIVQKWDQIGNPLGGANAIPKLAKQGMLEGGPDLQVFGPASHMNLDIRWDIPKSDVQVEPGSVDVQVRTHKPEIEYHRGAVEVYLKQRPSVSFDAVGLDVRV